MKFFHAVANGRKNRNFITIFNQNGNIPLESREIGRVFTEHFKQLFGNKRPSRIKIDFQKLFRFKTPVDLSTQERPFSVEEIWKAVFKLGGDKAPGPNGVPLQFFKQF